MRILHVVGQLNRGGAETWLVQMLRHIDRQKYRMDFLVHTTDPGAYDEEVKALGARILPCLKPSNPLQYAYNFRRILREYGPYDCVHSHVHQYSGYVVWLAAKFRVPVRIAQSHSDTSAINRDASFLRKKYIAAMEMFLQRYATKGIAVSENAAAALFRTAWKSDRRWSVCPLGIDLRPFEQDVDKQQVRKELGIPAQALVVGHVGRFVAVKNHRFVVEVAESLFCQRSKAMFLLVGDGPLRPEIEALVRAMGLSDRFVFTGTRPDVPRIMKGAMDCFLFPSLYEGVPLVLWEAQAAALPCVTSETVAQESDVVPFLVRRLSLDDSPNRWAQALTAMVSANYKSRGATPVELAKCSIETSAAAIESLYLSLNRPVRTNDPIARTVSANNSLQG